MPSLVTSSSKAQATWPKLPYRQVVQRMTEHALVDWIFGTCALEALVARARMHVTGSARTGIIVYTDDVSCHPGLWHNTNLFNSRASAIKFAQDLNTACQRHHLSVSISWRLKVEGFLEWTQGAPYGTAGTLDAVECLIMP